MISRASHLLLRSLHRHDAIELGRRRRAARRGGVSGDGLLDVEIGDDAPRDAQGVMIVLRQVVDNARLARVQIAAAQILRAHHLPRGGFHQRRPAEEDGALVLDDDGLIRHRRHIGAAGGAGAHHRRDLRNAQRRQRRLIVEDAAEMLAVGKHFSLMRQVGAAAIHQIDAGQPVLARDFLRAQMFLHRHRKVGAALDGASRCTPPCIRGPSMRPMPVIRPAP